MDWNNDEKADLLAGDTSGGIQVFLNNSATSRPQLSKGQYIYADSQLLNGGERMTPDIADWNSDGKKDIIAGNMNGNLRVYLNEGSDESPLFKSFTHVRIKDRIFDLGSRSAPRIFDWDGDGLQDILTGEMNGYIYYLKNTGTTASPEFQQYGKLMLNNGEFLRYPDSSGNPRSRLYITDWNNDGLNDILTGGRTGEIILHLNSGKKDYSPSSVIRLIVNSLKERVLSTKLLMRRLVKAPEE